MKKITLILTTLIILILNVNMLFADGDLDQSLVMKGGTGVGNNNEDPRQIENLIRGDIKDKKVEFQFDPSLGHADVTVKNNNSVIKQTAVNSALRSDLEFSLDELGTGDIRIDFVDQEGNSAYATFTVH